MYWVVEFDSPKDIHRLESACALIPNDIELGFQVHKHSSFAVSSHPGIMQAFCQNIDYDRNPPKQLSMEDLGEIRRNFDDIMNLPGTFPHIRRALDQFGELRMTCPHCLVHGFS